MSPTPKDKDQELKDKLRQIRADYTRAKNLLKEIDTYYKAFSKLRDQLDDADRGLAVSITWVTEQRDTITKLLGDANTRLSELETTASSVTSKVDEISKAYDDFKNLSAEVFDNKTGMKALLQAVKKWHQSVEGYETQAKDHLSSTEQSLTDAQALTEAVLVAFEDFESLQTRLNHPDTGVEAQLRQIDRYVKDAEKAKTDAENELASVKSIKLEGDKELSSAKSSREEIQKFKRESDVLTADIRNNLGLTSSYSLSEALKKRTKKLNNSARLWGLATLVTTLLLAIAAASIFYFLFVYDGHNGNTYENIKNGPTLVSVISKTLFTSPLIFGVYFTATNFGHARELRDKYSFKETIATNLSAYIHLLGKEYESGASKDIYKKDRHAFTLKHMDAIYSEPSSMPKKRRYSFGINKFFNVSMEDEDLKRLETAIVDKVEDYVEDKVKDNKQSTRQEEAKTDNKTKTE